MTALPQCEGCGPARRRVPARGARATEGGAPRERGRPARTRPGTASANSSTRPDPQRPRDSASADPMPLPPAGWPGAASQDNRAARNGSACGRDARAPGWASPRDVVVPEEVHRYSCLFVFIRGSSSTPPAVYSSYDPPGRAAAGIVVYRRKPPESSMPGDPMRNAGRLEGSTLFFI